MSDFDATPVPAETNSDDRPSLGREIAREATINVAANAAGVIGFAAGVVIVGKVVDKVKARRAAKNKTEAPETTESQES